MNFFDRLFAKKNDEQKAPRTYPYFCTLDDTGITSNFPERLETRKITFEELESVSIRTGEGPISWDVFWVLEGGGKKIWIPIEADGEPELVKELMKLSRFDHRAMTDAMSTSQNALFRCWTKVDTN